MTSPNGTREIKAGKLWSRKQIIDRLNQCMEQYRKNHAAPDTTAMMQYMLHGKIRGLFNILNLPKPPDSEILAGLIVKGK